MKDARGDDADMEADEADVLQLQASASLISTGSCVRDTGGRDGATEVQA